MPGDIVLLEAGDKVPADLRLLRVNGLQVQEAILTGESVPVEKHTQPVAEAAPLGDRGCMAYSGTLVTSGLGRGVVVSTGADTEIGRISGMLSTVETLTTPLLRQMNVFARWLTVLILLIGVQLACRGAAAMGWIGHLRFGEVVIFSFNTSDIPVMPLAFKVAEKPAEGKHTVFDTHLKVRKKKHDLVVSIYDKPSGKILSTKIEIDPQSLKRDE